MVVSPRRAALGKMGLSDLATKGTRTFLAEISQCTECPKARFCAKAASIFGIVCGAGAVAMKFRFAGDEG